MFTAHEFLLFALRQRYLRIHCREQFPIACKFVSSAALCKYGSFENCLIIINGALVCLTSVASGSVVKCSLLTFIYGAQQLLKAHFNSRKCLISTCLLAEHQGGYEAARGRHEADRGRHEADRGRHEAELWNEDIRYMWFPVGPNSLSLG
ncbi:hypothetical protein T4C_12061 [Trichinella pseudospiralis]|uniref:Uncharacterized protein n=1 Tax=Trichinella pseudospiralis TaxID=6337 RepID=A0A0V1JQG4_TRIPS|nr:hypothetical protein T4C_12061 [Trichinella pseudospiralis]